MAKLSSSQQSNAGKTSGLVRAKSAEIRRFIVKAAFARLPRSFHTTPYADLAVEALQLECKNSPSIEKNDEEFDRFVSLAVAGHPITMDVPIETLKKDMKRLGIRSKLRQCRSR
jgi:hypothetical protein